jgi:3-phosphoshikimate 1-carboxyvinyltransferase
MKIKVKKSQLNGVISVPGSKSHTIRAVAIAAAAEGTSLIRFPLHSEDTFSALYAAEALGAEIERSEDIWKVTGTGGNFEILPGLIDMGNSGTSLRIFTALAAMGNVDAAFDGDDSLRSRPMGPLLNALQELGVKVESNNGKCPLNVCGPAKGGKTVVDGTSSQFVTALLIALPLAENDSYVKVVNLNEIPYVEITLAWLARQGISIEYPDEMSYFRIVGRQAYHAFDSVIPADFSTAAFPLAAAALTRGNVSIKNLDFSDLQGDKAVFSYLQRMGTEITTEGNRTVVSAGNKLKGMEFDLNATPDALPVMAVVGACSEGTTSLINCPQARIKETDRITCMAAELQKLGCRVRELEDGLVIEGCRQLKGAELNGYNDHRIVMALTIAGMMADGETVISTAESAAVTYPSFIEDFKRLGADITIL